MFFGNSVSSPQMDLITWAFDSFRMLAIKIGYKPYFGNGDILSEGV